MENDQGRAYAQWVVLEFINRMRSDLVIKNAWLRWGKFHKDGDKDSEISTTDVNTISALPGKRCTVSSCGRESAASGTEGDLDLYDGNTKICKVYWDCPWGSPTNKARILDYDPSTSNYAVVLGPYNTSGGALGRVDITVSKLG
ncbi:Asp-hemolysin [Metarhizium brunneum]